VHLNDRLKKTIIKFDILGCTSKFSIFSVYEAGCGVRVNKICFIKKRIYLIIIIDAIIIIFCIDFEKLVFLFIPSTSTFIL
jgi:hypothetical protein